MKIIFNFSLIILYRVYFILIDYNKKKKKNCHKNYNYHP